MKKIFIILIILSFGFIPAAIWAISFEVYSGTSYPTVLNATATVDPNSDEVTITANIADISGVAFANASIDSVVSNLTMNHPDPGDDTWIIIYRNPNGWTPGTTYNVDINTADWLGYGNYYDNIAPFAAEKESPSLTLLINPESQTYGNTVIFSGTLAPLYGTDPKAIKIMEGQNQWAEGQTDSLGEFNISYIIPATIPDGAHNLQAVFDGDAFNNSAQSSQQTLNVRHITMLDSYSTPTEQRPGGNIDLWANLTKTDGTPIYKTVKFYDSSGAEIGQTTSGATPLTIQLSNYAVPDTSISFTARFEGDNSYAPSEDTTFVSVLRHTCNFSSFSVIANAPTLINDNITVYGTVEDINGTVQGQSSATVNDFTSSYTICSQAGPLCLPDSTGYFSSPYVVQAPKGPHTISATYEDTTHEICAATVSVDVFQPTKISSFGVYQGGVLKRSVRKNTSVNLKAWLVDKNTGTPLIGIVNFYRANGTFLGSAPTDTNGMAVLSWKTPNSAGTITLRAIFDRNNNNYIEGCQTGDGVSANNFVLTVTN